MPDRHTSRHNLLALPALALTGGLTECASGGGDAGGGESGDGKRSDDGSDGGDRTLRARWDRGRTGGSHRPKGDARTVPEVPWCPLRVAARRTTESATRGSTDRESEPDSRPPRPPSELIRADGGYVEVALSDWDAVEENLRRFARGGRVEVDADRITVTVGSAHVTVTRDGYVETGMPLHEFEKGGVETLRFDHEAGHLRIHGADGLDYEFRRP